MAIVPAAMAYWMNRSTCLASREVIQRVGSQLLISPANLVAKFEASKWVIGPMPERPSMRPFQVSSVPMPTGVTRPTPVITTRRLDMNQSPP